MPRKRKATRRSTKRKSSTRKLAGFTRTGGKFALVFRKDGKLMLGKSRYASKKTLTAAAAKLRR